jgi:hypothetical protein
MHAYKTDIQGVALTFGGGRRGSFTTYEAVFLVPTFPAVQFALLRRRVEVLTSRF